MIIRNPSLLFPVGSLEPVGENVALGAINYCCSSVVDALSRKLEMLCAPMLMYANNTPFKSFGGCSGIHTGTLINVISECCNGWHFQGFKRIIVITFAMDGQLGIDEAMARINKKQKNDNAIQLFSLQNEPFFRSFCASRVKGKEFGRSEWGIHALVSYLCPQLRSIAAVDSKKSLLPEEKAFRRWHKCGRDPEKLRKMVPDATLSENVEIPDAVAGKELFDFIIIELTKKITHC